MNHGVVQPIERPSAQEAEQAAAIGSDAEFVGRALSPFAMRQWEPSSIAE